MGDWAGIITPKKGLGGWKAEKLDLGLDGQRCGGNGCQQAGEQEDRLDCQGDIHRSCGDMGGVPSAILQGQIPVDGV